MKPLELRKLPLTLATVAWVLGVQLVYLDSHVKAIQRRLYRPLSGPTPSFSRVLAGLDEEVPRHAQCNLDC